MSTNLFLESDLESEFCRAAKLYGCYCLKLVVKNSRGFPDQTVFTPSYRVAFVEFKRSKLGRMSGPQRNRKKILESLGFRHFVVSEFEQIEPVLNEILKL